LTALLAAASRTAIEWLLHCFNTTDQENASGASSQQQSLAPVVIRLRRKRIGNRCGGIDNCRYGDLCDQCVVNHQKETAPGKNLEQGIERLKEAAGQGMESRQ